VLHLALIAGAGRLPGRVQGVLVATGYAVTVGVQGLLSAVGFVPRRGVRQLSVEPLARDHRRRWAPSVDAVGVRAGLIWSVLAMATLLVTALRASAARRRRAVAWLPAGVFLE
jgi:hypothetical protein